jgi:hypothetical protein
MEGRPAGRPYGKNHKRKNENESVGKKYGY